MRFAIPVAPDLVALSSAVLALQGATGVVKARMEAMKKDTAVHMKTIAGMIRGEANLDIDRLAASSKLIANHADKMPDLFPKGSIKGPGEALPEIWLNWDDFITRAVRLAARARRLAAVAGLDAEVRAIAAAFAAMGETCKNCHTSYRVRKQ